MTKVFIGGSRRIGRLDQSIRQRLDNIIDQSFTILVGDANGVDKAIQQHCANRNYQHINVFCSGKSCRNNIGGWEIRYINVDRPNKDYKFYMAKDIEMAKQADYGFMIWDIKSSGTLSNIIELLEMGKKVLVYIAPTKNFEKLHTLEDLDQILKMCPQESIKTFDNKFNLSGRLHPGQPDQLQMFS